MPGDLVRLSEVTGAPLEINLFHHSRERIAAIAAHLREFGAVDVLEPTTDAVIATLSSDRRYVNPDGIARADVVFVPLEDGDRCGALRAAGKLVIAVDLNPMSRTSRDASITIVDNVVRAVPRMIARVAELGGSSNESTLQRDIDSYAHDSILVKAEHAIRSGAS